MLKEPSSELGPPQAAVTQKRSQTLRAKRILYHQFSCSEAVWSQIHRREQGQVGTVTCREPVLPHLLLTGHISDPPHAEQPCQLPGRGCGSQFCCGHRFMSLPALASTSLGHYPADHRPHKHSAVQLLTSHLGRACVWCTMAFPRLATSVCPPLGH